MDPTPFAATITDRWEKYWLDRFPCDAPSGVPYPYAPINIFLEDAARRFPNHPACTLYGKKTSFAELDLQARRLARGLSELGARPGRFVGILLPNIPEYLAALQATWLTGATVLQLSPLMVAEEIAHWLKLTGCHIVVTLDLLAPAVTGSLNGNGPLEHVVIATLVKRIAMWKSLLYRVERVRRNGTLRMREDAHRHHFDHLLAHEPIADIPAIIPNDDVAVLCPTGGTTDSPKAVMLTHHNLVANAMQLRHWAGGGDATEGVLGVLPFFHAYGLMVSVLTSWVRGSTIHLHPRFEAAATVDILERERPALVPAVPAVLNALTRVMMHKPSKYDLSFVRAVISGASPLDNATREAFDRFFPQNVVEGYGLSEASPVTHVNPTGVGNRPGTIGLPVVDTLAKIVDPENGKDELPPGEVGELAVRGPQVMKGYYKNPQATDAVIRDGWLYTGDMAKRDANNYYTIVDRKKDIIKTSGFLVYPGEVEEVLRRHPAIAEVAVIGIPDAERGEVVKAMVVPKNGKFDKSQLDSYCKEHLGKHKRPREVEILRELPKNFLGKVMRRKLREMSTNS
jgi:long-chain acyl-CoA synthetase